MKIQRTKPFSPQEVLLLETDLQEFEKDLRPHARSLIKDSPHRAFLEADTLIYTALINGSQFIQSNWNRARKFAYYKTCLYNAWKDAMAKFKVINEKLDGRGLDLVVTQKDNSLLTTDLLFENVYLESFELEIDEAISELPEDIRELVRLKVLFGYTKRDKDLFLERLSLGDRPTRFDYLWRKASEKCRFSKNEILKKAFPSRNVEPG